MKSTAKMDEVNKIIYGDHNDPFSVLGMHPYKPRNEPRAVVVRAFYPDVASICVVSSDGQKYCMDRLFDPGFFEVLIKERDELFTYTLEITNQYGHTFSTPDPYSFLPFIPEVDLYLFNKGDNHKIYDKLGAHPIEINGIWGTLFGVWAPCAKRVSVVGSFNLWDGRRHMMRRIGNSGVWEIFIPYLACEEVYKYEIRTPFDEIYLKADPYAFYAELRPNTASIVYDLNRYQWNDQSWMQKRDSGNFFDKPISIYEVHLGSWVKPSEEDPRSLDPENRFLNYREMADKLVQYVLDMGFTHIELLPVTEHPFDGSWGYQVTGYYAITSRYGKPEDFMYFVDKCHQNNIAVIMDWVPAHFPKDGHGLARFDGTACYEHEDPRQGEHLEWGTHIFNYGRKEVTNFLVSNALFWMEKYHIDGLRVDAVAAMLYLDYCKKPGEWVPNEYGGKENIQAIDFFRQLNGTVYQYYPGVMMIAEESTSWPLVTKPAYTGGLGFTFKWNMGWMNDFLRYMSMDSIYRKYHQNDLTFASMYAFSENFVLGLSHDEVVHGKCSMINKMPGDQWQKFANLRAAYLYMFGFPGKKLNMMGNEFGQFSEWYYKEELTWSLLENDLHKKMQNFFRDLNRLYTCNRSLYEIDFHYDGFEYIDCNDHEHSIISFVRKAKDWRDMLVFICNFTPAVYHNYRIGAPVSTYYDEVFNSDSEKYGGSNVGNFHGIFAEQIPLHNKPCSLSITIPPLATIVLRPRI